MLNKGVSNWSRLLSSPLRCYPSQILSPHSSPLSAQWQHLSLTNRPYGGIFIHSSQPVTGSRGEGHLAPPLDWGAEEDNLQPLFLEQKRASHQPLLPALEKTARWDLRPSKLFFGLQRTSCSQRFTHIFREAVLWVIPRKICLGDFYFTIPSNTCPRSLFPCLQGLVLSVSVLIIILFYGWQVKLFPCGNCHQLFSSCKVWKCSWFSLFILNSFPLSLPCWHILLPVVSSLQCQWKYTGAKPAGLTRNHLVQKNLSPPSSGHVIGGN